MRTHEVRNNVQLHNVPAHVCYRSYHSSPSVSQPSFRSMNSMIALTLSPIENDTMIPPSV